MSLLPSSGSRAAGLGRLAAGFILLQAFATLPAPAQALMGTTSLIRVPTAEMPPDGLFRLTTGFVHRDYSSLSASTHLVQYGTSLAFLPFLELGFRFNKQVDARDALGDRMLSARVRFLTEGRARPALVLGVHDFLRSTESMTTKFHALYLVASKHASWPSFAGRRGSAVHAGYATDLVRARGYELRGLFGGFSISAADYLDVLAEYDGEHVNFGTNLSLLGALTVLIGLQGLSRFTGGASLGMQL